MAIAKLNVKTRMMKLSNGLRIVLDPMPNRDSVALGVWVGVGGRFESKENAGISHFIEHVVFKGTRQFDNHAIKQRIEGCGGILNAFTDEESTCYYAKTLRQHVSSTLEILAEMCLVPLLNSLDIEQERKVIMEEIKMYRDVPSQHISDMLNKIIWPDQPLGRMITGSEKTVQKITPAKLRRYRQNHYVANNIVVVAAGNVDAKKFVRDCRKYFGSLKRGRRHVPAKSRHRTRGPYVNTMNKDIAQGHLCLGIPAYHRSHPDRYALDLINIVLGGNMSSRLFQAIREDKGLAYEIRSSYSKMNDTGVFVIYAGVEKTKMYNALEDIIKELERLAANGVSAKELDRAKQYCQGTLRLYLEGTISRMIWQGESVLAHNNIGNLSYILAKLDRVRPSDILRVSRKLFGSTREFHLSVIAKSIARDKINRILRKR